MALHSALTDSDGIHEPKGISTASNNEVYVANGSGSGTWAPTFYTITSRFNDVSVADTIYIPVPYAGTVAKVVTVLDGAITGANDTITVRNAAGASMGTITITQSGSAAGDVDTLVPVSNNTIANDSFVRLDADGASGTAQILYVTVVIERS